MSEELREQDQAQTQLEGGTYEIIRGRMRGHAKELRSRLAQLNEARKATFGSIETKLMSTQRVMTDNNCVPRDMVSVGNRFLFGYNVHLGLRSETHLKDVFSVYEFRDGQFHTMDLDLLDDERFVADFENLYKYYKHTTFAKFAIIGLNLFMKFRTGKSVSDFKTFKWAFTEDGLTYIDNRSDHEFKYPPQHEFEWTRSSRDSFRMGQHPHISIQDRVFVETVGGDLTIKVEDNTQDGVGIYREPVDDADQTLDDAEVFYAAVGHVILLKIKPYQEKDWRYLVFNEKLQEVHRVDAIQDACVLLPDDHGLIFPKGYYLLTGELKEFDNALASMSFEKRIPSNNGEDYLYVFYNRESGTYILLSYNLINQTVETPIICNGYSFFEDGTLMYFRAEDQPNKHHAIQVWQTPYTGPNFVQEAHADSPIYAVGNKDIVRCMAECNEALTLVAKEDTYANLYVDIAKKCTDIRDSYFWIKEAYAHDIATSLDLIGEAAQSAIDEFEKVNRIKKATREEIKRVAEKADDLFKRVSRAGLRQVDEFVSFLGELRTLRGEMIGCKERRYTDIAAVEDLEKKAAEQNDKLSAGCVEFLLKEEALEPYLQRVTRQETLMNELAKVADAREIDQELDRTSSDLELLIEIVSNLKIDDPTRTTRIIDSVSAIFADLNRVKTGLKNRVREMARVEGVAEFNAQVKLLSQSVVNYLDVCDSPDKCETYLTKLTVQIEELEGRFSEFDEFVAQLTEKREEVYNAFESKRLQLVEARNRKASTLFSSAERILKGIRGRIAKFTDVNEINGYFAGDLMVDKVRTIIEELNQLEDSVKASDLQTRLKTVREEAVRQLKDKNELFEGGGNLIKLGKHRFSVNTQNLALTVVYRDGKQFYHLTGTDFFEEIDHASFLATRPVWEMEVSSENRHIYRAEYLAWQMLKAMKTTEHAELATAEGEQLLGEVQRFMGPRYGEGYAKGVHDHDARSLFETLRTLHQKLGLLKYPTAARALASLYWHRFCPETSKTALTATGKGLAALIELFPDSETGDEHIEELRQQLKAFNEEHRLFPDMIIDDAAEYLFRQVITGGPFAVSREAGELYRRFDEYLNHRHFAERFQQATVSLHDQPVKGYLLVQAWVRAFRKSELPQLERFEAETAVLIFTRSFAAEAVADIATELKLEGLKGDHPLITKGSYTFNYNAYVERLTWFSRDTQPQYETYTRLKKELADRFAEDLRLKEFEPRVLTSFVRNKLLDQVYLPLIGDNLAKQIGAAGDNTRTDRMGMLLLISPPGYGKTTLMEYVSNRLGLIFMKINGPAIGHEVTSIDPAAAPHGAAREELNKLNLSLEMGDNVMIYLDDIQHCNPEFLQKFISLCDAQRKIEGIYKGRPRTYDLRGKKVCVIMAGNPYTESGEKFQIPDMLANRADTYNLGDIIGDSREVFELSYIENSLTSNPILNKLASRSQADVHALIQVAKTGQREGLELEGNYGNEEINEFVSVLQKLMRVQDVILKVNLEYIRSAAQEDAYRTEPPFKLQGSYRNMNKIAEKILPIMNDQELETLLHSHYENEAQTLTSGAEANLLKFRELTETMTPEQKERWADIKRTFGSKQRLMGVDQDDKVGQVVLQLSHFREGLDAIRETLINTGEAMRARPTETHLSEQTITALSGLLGKGTREINLGAPTLKVLGSGTNQNMSGELALSRETLESLNALIAANRVEPSQTTHLSKETLQHLTKLVKHLVSGMSKTVQQVQQQVPGTDADEDNATSIDPNTQAQHMMKVLRRQFEVMQHWIKPTFESSREQDKQMESLTSAINNLMATHGSLLNYLQQFQGSRKK